MENPLLGYLLVASPPALAPVRASERPPACAECRLAGGDGNDFYWLEPRGPMLCRICALCRTAAWEPQRVRLALIPEFGQGLLNGVVTMLTVNLLRMRAGEPISSGIDGVWQSHLLDTLQHRAKATALALPAASSPARLRQTLRALPAAARAEVMTELAGLRLLPEPKDPELARFFNRRCAVADLTGFFQ